MRIGWIDSWRGTLILLVVVGHVVGECFHFSTVYLQPCLRFFYKSIYTFHMPAFFVLAGLTFSDKKIGVRQFISKKIKRLLIPYFLWGFLSAAIYVAMGDGIKSLFSGATTYRYAERYPVDVFQPFLSILHAGGWPDGRGFQCNSVLWFLPAIFTLEIAFFCLQRLLKSKMGLLLVAVLCIPFWFFLRIPLSALPFGIGCAVRYYPFFVIGYMIVSTDFYRQKVVKGSLVIPFCILLALHLGACAITPNQGLLRQYFLWNLVFFVIALGGTATSAIGAMIADSSLLRLLGRDSLSIMLLHKFAVVAFVNFLPLGRSINRHGVFFAFFVIVAVSIASMAICCLAHSFIEKRMPQLIGLPRRETVMDEGRTTKE